MGAEVALHAVRPQATSARDRLAVIFSPERALEVDVLALAGADLDEDVALGWEATAPPGEARSPRLWWLTLPNPDGNAGRDRVLVLRKVARGKRAVGNVVPRLRAEQIDNVVGARGLIFDTHRIPRNHDFLAYYSPERLASLAGAAGELQAPWCHASPLLETLDRVLAAPDDRAALQPYLETGEPTVTLYALWRLERHYCGDSRHLENRYLLQIDRLAYTHPERLEQERATSPCRLVREGIWPGIHGRTGQGSTLRILPLADASRAGPRLD
jgi:hypothetical protein